MIPQETQYYIDKINSSADFRAVWNVGHQYVQVFLNNNELFPMSDELPALLSRQQGYDLRISEMFKTELEFQSAEEKYINKDESELYHKHYYFFTKAMTNNRVQVLIKYFDAPDNSNVTDIDQFLDKIKRKVRLNPDYQMQFQPFGKEDFDMKLDISGFRIRPKQQGPFYFSTELDADTYGEVLLKVDQIIHSLEN